MFLGTTPSIISQYIQKQIKRTEPNRTFVPFAGNFVIEQLSAIVYPDAEIHSTDVSLYSRLLGFGLSGQECEATIKDEILEDFPVFAKHKSPMNLAIACLFFEDVGDCYLKPDIRYYQNKLRDARTNQEEYYKQISDKLNKFKTALDNSEFHFYGCDACEILPKVMDGDFVFYDPPFWEEGYEKMFKGLEHCMNFENPDYTLITEELKDEQLAELRDSGANVMFRTLNPLDNIPEGYKEVYRYQYKYHLSYCLYSTKKEETFVSRFTALREKQKKYAVISEEDVITADSDIHIEKVESKVANHYRLMWTKKAEMKSCSYNYLVFIDKKLIGLFCLRSGLNFGTDLATIFADISAPTSNYPRLSKLILYLVCTEEVLTDFNNETMWEHEGFTTAVYTNHPVSMKYRKQFELAERSEQDEGRTKYKLIYQNRDRILPTCQDGLEAWLDSKDGSIVYDESLVPDKLLEW